jgi:Pyridoxamine 5'-phosphate oxidase
VLPDWPNGTVTILVTSGEKPHAIPISTAIRAGRRTVLLALASGRESLRRLRADPAVALAVMAGDNLAVTLHGTASVLEEPLPEEAVAVAIDVAHVQDHCRPAFEIEAGVRWRWIDPEAEQRDARVRAALERIASRGELA